MILTSKSHPLQIDYVTPDRCRGRIGMTLCPGKQEANAISGDWQRDLELDLQNIRDWGASAIVSLMEQEEMEWYGVAALPEKTRALGMQHFHLPVVDMDIPRKEFEQNWLVYGAELRHLLLSDQSIVVHCLGGLGRTGTITARLLIELGMDADTAISRVRKARPGAIQTVQQEVYVRRCKPSR